MPSLNQISREARLEKLLNSKLYGGATNEKEYFTPITGVKDQKDSQIEVKVSESDSQSQSQSETNQNFKGQGCDSEDSTSTKRFDDKYFTLLPTPLRTTNDHHVTDNQNPKFDANRQSSNLNVNDNPNKTKSQSGSSKTEIPSWIRLTAGKPQDSADELLKKVRIMKIKNSTNRNQDSSESTTGTRKKQQEFSVPTKNDYFSKVPLSESSESQNRPKTAPVVQRKPAIPNIPRKKNPSENSILDSNANELSSRNPKFKPVKPAYTKIDPPGMSGNAKSRPVTNNSKSTVNNLNRKFNDTNLNMMTLSDLVNNNSESDSHSRPSTVGTTSHSGSSSSRLRHTTEAYRRRNGTTAKTLDQVGYEAMTDDKKKSVDYAREKVGVKDYRVNGGSSASGGQISEKITGKFGLKSDKANVWGFK